MKTDELLAQLKEVTTALRESWKNKNQ